MSRFPKVSIIIPTYNAEGTLEACLQSVVSQTYENLEIIVVDGLSQDGTRSIAGKYAGKLRWISEPDEGIYDAMNKGIAAAAGEWLYFLGSDDTLKTPAILDEIFTNEEVHRYDVIYGNALFKLAQKKYDGAFSSVKLLGKNICHQAMFTRKEVFARLGKFDTRYKALADYAFNMNWFHNDAIRKLYVDKIIAVYNEDGYCFNNPDLAFAADKDRLVEQYFPAHARWLNAHRNNRFVYYLLKKLTK